MEKKEMRKLVSSRLKEIGRTAYEDDSYSIAKALCRTDEWREAGTIGLTVSRFPEADTWQLIRRGWEEGKRIAVPKCLPETRGMSFRVLENFRQLEKAYSGLFEPVQELTEEAGKTEIGLLIIPGLAFTADGRRLGFGGGYYDRYLEDFNGNRIALAFSDQIVGDLPTEQHDQKIPAIITEKGIIRCRVEPGVRPRV